MKILAIHSDHISITPTKKAIKSAEESDKAEQKIDDCLVVFISVESAEEGNETLAAQKLIDQIKEISSQVKTNKIVLYPYAHLSSNLAKPDTAISILKQSEELLKTEGYEVTRAAFGWYKAFEIKCKGHPLSELSREISVVDDSKKPKDKKDQDFSLSTKKLSNDQKTALSAAAIVGMAVKEIFNNAEIGSMDFYHEMAYVDVSGVKLSTEDLRAIEKRTRKIISQNLSFEKTDSAVGKYQQEIKKDLADNAVVYKIDNETFVPLYDDPFIKNTSEIQAIKLFNLSSAYWKNNANNKQLERIYLVSYDSKDKLKAYLEKQMEAEKRDHRIITKDLNLVYFHEYSPGAPFFLKNGTIIYNTLIDFVKSEYNKRGYDEVITPQIYNKKLWEISGHWDHYRDDMFIVKIEGQEHSLKPMNCPSHCLIYKRDVKSYKELPLRIADFCNLHRNELSGTLSGLTRVRKFAQDDGHIFCRFDQIEQEVSSVLDFIKFVWEEVFNFKLKYYLSTRPEKALGTKEIWDKAETLLSNALKKRNIDFEIKEGDGAFYGPKIDMDIEDALGRKWQCPTCQLDFNLPHRFELTYEGSDGKRHEPVMIHRAVLGSIERFFGIMVEHFAGKFPLWLSPVQAMIVTVTDRNVEFAKEIEQKMKDKGIRADLDIRTETIGKKVRDAQVKKINYIVTIGDKEVENNNLAVRSRAGDVKFGLDADEFIQSLLDEINKREIK